MKVFLTGGTGLVGAHTALALLRAGHEVHFLVRNQQLAKQYYREQGFNLEHIIEADMLDTAAVKNAMQGCDAVFHAAAMVSLDPKQAESVYQSNINSIDAVIGSAINLGIKNIIYVSSLAALFNPKAETLDESSPLGVPRDAYMRSKRDCEAHVRTLQSQGAPIQITYPSGVFAPNDPKLSESNQSLTTLLNFVPITSSGLQFVDARDLAAAHLALLSRPASLNAGDNRFIVGGHFLTWQQYHQLLENVTQRNIMSLAIPGAILRGAGNMMELVKRIYPINVPVSTESMAIVTQFPAGNSSKAINTLNITFRPAEDTFKDTIQWMAQQQHLSKRLAGTLAHSE